MWPGPWLPVEIEVDVPGVWVVVVVPEVGVVAGCVWVGRTNGRCFFPMYLRVKKGAPGHPGVDLSEQD